MCQLPLCAWGFNCPAHQWAEYYTLSQYSGWKTNIFYGLKDVNVYQTAGMQTPSVWKAPQLPGHLAGSFTRELGDADSAECRSQVCMGFSEMLFAPARCWVHWVLPLLQSYQNQISCLLIRHPCCSNMCTFVINSTMFFSLMFCSLVFLLCFLLWIGEAALSLVLASLDSKH